MHFALKLVSDFCLFSLYALLIINQIKAGTKASVSGEVMFVIDRSCSTVLDLNRWEVPQEGCKSKVALRSWFVLSLSVTITGRANAHLI